MAERIQGIYIEADSIVVKATDFDALFSLAAQNTKLRQELSLAEERLANYAQEVEQLRKANEKLQTLVIWSVDTMSALHRAIEPMEDDPELAGRVPPAAMRAFVDALADIDRERFGLHPKGDGT